ncbi:P-loop containing nucleoside triphosphate hydrolase protein, partial [Dentipellis sp. KUC8613]
MLWPSSRALRILSFSRLQFRYRSTTATTATSNLVLRPYQESCLTACLDALKEGSTRIGVSLPTGSGKTAVFISLLSQIRSVDSDPEGEPGSEATRALVVVNSVELARQAASQARTIRPDWSVEIEQGARHRATGTADVTVATYQTLLQRERLMKFDPRWLKAIIIDEAHHAAAPSYRRILSYFEPDIQSPDADEPTGTEKVPTPVSRHIPIIGFSATFSRHDGLALGSVFQRIVYHQDFLHMVKEQWLCNVRFTTVKADLNLKQVTVSARTGDFNASSLAHVINTDTINNLVVQTWMDKAANRKSTLVFCVNIAHVRRLTAVFRSAGFDARYLYSGTPAAERHDLVNAFKKGKFPVLVNCGILTEGTDIPNIDCVIVARPTRSRNLFTQIIGRGMRNSPHSGKTDCLVIDFVDTINRIPGIVCTPTLFGLNPSELVDDVPIDELEARANASEAEGTLSVPQADIDEPKSVTYIDYEDPFALVGHASRRSQHIAQLSRNAWVSCGDDIYVLECMGKGHLRIEPSRGNGADDDTGDPDVHFRAHFAPQIHYGTAAAMKVSPFRANRNVLTAATLADAVHGCDTYAASKVVPGPLALGMLRTAKWRRDPATPSQKAFIGKRWGMHAQELKRVDGAVEATFPDRVESLTKGDAAGIITRLKHGAQSRYAKKVLAMRRAEVVNTKEQRRQASLRVKVGPL